MVLWVVVRMQSLYRIWKSREALKQLQSEARDVHILKAERDRFREEALRLRRELEAKEAKQRKVLAEANGYALTSTENMANQKSKIEAPPMHLRKEEIAKYEKEVQSLAAESAEKDAELARLRDEIAFLRSPEGISIIHEQLSFISSPARSRNTPENSVQMIDRQDWTFTPEKAARTITNGERSLTSTNRSLFATKSSPARPEHLRGDAGSPALGLSLLDAEGDTGIMVVSPMSRVEISGGTLIHDPSLRPADGQHRSFSIDTLLFRKAVHDGEFETVEKFLRESKLCDLLINECDETGRCPLHIAVIECRWKVVGALLGNDAAANVQDLAGNTPLHVAPNASMMALLLDEGRANPNIPNMDGECALHLAVKSLDDAAVEVLLGHGANVNCADNTAWYTPLHLISQADIDERAHLDMLQDEFEEERRKRVRIAKLLCDATDPCEPDLDYQDWEGNTPLHHVVMLTSELACDMLHLFLESGGNPKIVNNRGQTALHLLSHNDSLRKLEVFQEMLHDILFHGANPNQTSLTGCTALHLSLYHRDVDSAIQLVNSGAELHLLWRKVRLPLRALEHLFSNALTFILA